MGSAVHGVEPALADVVAQLWGAAIDTGNYRVRTDGEAVSGWQVMREFDVFPTRTRPRMLVERSRPRGVAAALLAYRGLRPPRAQAARLLTAAAACAPAARSRRSLILERRAGVTAPPEPLGAASEALGRHVVAQVGVRTGANAKATAQLFSAAGVPQGYAKFGWTPLTGSYVQTEAQRLSHLAGRAGVVRVPRLLATGDAYGQPFLVSEPLPSEVRRLSRPDDLSVAELATLAPLRRRGHPAAVGQLVQMHERAERMRTSPVVAAEAEDLGGLVSALRALPIDIAVAEFDHGDLVPWNTCRDARGDVWAWDWESSVEDVVAGTDALHWFVHAAHGPAPSDLGAAISDAHHRCAPTFRALGLTRGAAHAVTGAYVAATVDRACSLALSHSSWARNRVGAAQVHTLVALGHHHVVAAQAGRP